MDTIIQRFLMRAPLLFGVIFIFQFIYTVPSLADNGITSVNSFGLGYEFESGGVDFYYSKIFYFIFELDFLKLCGG